MVIFHRIRQKCQIFRKVAIYLFLFTSKMFASRDHGVSRFLVDTTQWRRVCTLSAELLSTKFGMQLLSSASWCGCWQRENCWRGVAAPFSFTHLDGDLVRCTLPVQGQTVEIIMQKSFFFFFLNNKKHMNSPSLLVPVNKFWACVTSPAQKGLLVLLLFPSQEPRWV